MLSVIFRRSTFTVQKVLHWAGPPQRCWTSALARASNGGSVSSCWAPSTRLPSTERDTGPPAVLGLRRTELFHRIQTHDALLLMRNQHFHSSAVRLKKRAKREPRQRELELGKSPKPALYLWYTGLIPFIAPTLFMAANESFYSDLASAQVAYGASILAFMGGVRWGFALPESSPAKPDWMNLANSVVPPLLAWLAMLMNEHILSSGPMIIFGLGIALHYDLSLLPTYPSWLKSQCTFLVIMAAISLLATLVMYAIYPEKNLF